MVIVGENQSENTIVEVEDNVVVLVTNFHEDGDWSDIDTDSDTDTDISLYCDEFSDREELSIHEERRSYTILSMREIEQSQANKIFEIANALMIPSAEANSLLIHLNWNSNINIKEWIKHRKEIRKELGLSETIAKDNTYHIMAMKCGKCSKLVDNQPSYDAFCDHKFCRQCWKDIISIQLKDSKLVLWCPDESCNATVNQEMIRFMAFNLEVEGKTYRYLLQRSYITDSAKGQWCPTQGCHHAVLLDRCGIYNPNFTCKCLYSYCYKCLSESHRPVTCYLHDHWRLEISNNPAQRWQSLVSSSSSSMPFDFAAWNKYDAYYTHWDKLDTQQHEAITKLLVLQKKLNYIVEKQGVAPREVSFVIDGWLQAIECLRMLKWASVYDYFNLTLQGNRKSFYNSLIHLGYFVMWELGKSARKILTFNDIQLASAEFEDFKNTLCLKSRVARNYFNNMDTAIQQGFTDLESLRVSICTRESIERGPPTDVADAAGRKACPHCRFPHDGSTTICVMCYMLQ